MQSRGDDVRIWDDWRVLASPGYKRSASTGEMVMDRDDEILTLDEIAAYLKIAKRTVYRLVQKGEIPAFKLGGTWRFRRSELDRRQHQQQEGASRVIGYRLTPFDSMPGGEDR
jgi:excisionase family DNA binding protein